MPKKEGGTGLPFWTKWKAATAERERVEKTQCARDVALAASFVRSLETEDRAVNLELSRLAGHLERIAGQLEQESSAEAA